MKNYCIKDATGREHWISRSIAAVVCIIAKDTHGLHYVLAVQRGKGTPDPEYVGKYCMPCGYLDYDETIVQAAQREVKEETGLLFPISDFKLININDDPSGDKRQNITFRYAVVSDVPVEDLVLLLNTENAEKDEVESIRFIKLSSIELYEWAFNHEELIKEITHDLFYIRH
jgi:8-oxo-dGTP pyrophosphatase MutT (NUDIX family)